MATKWFFITQHALRRFVERYAGIADLKVGEIRQVLKAELGRGVPLGGGQASTSTLYLLPCRLVAAVVWHNGRGFVKTVLTREQGIVAAQGVQLRRGRSVTPELRELAEQHFNAGLSWKERTASLRARGYDPEGCAGEMYRAAYQALERAKWAAA